MIWFEKICWVINILTKKVSERAVYTDKQLIVKRQKQNLTNCQTKSKGKHKEEFYLIIN